MKTHGHREGKHHILGSVGGLQGRDSRGMGRSGKDNMGRNARCSTHLEYNKLILKIKINNKKIKYNQF